jgi:hypothetical protein
LLFALNALLFALNELLFTTNALLFALNALLVTTNALLVALNELLFTTNAVLFALNELLFTTNAVLFVTNALLLDSNEGLVASNALLVALNSLLVAMMIIVLVMNTFAFIAFTLVFAPETLARTSASKLCHSETDFLNKTPLIVESGNLLSNPVLLASFWKLCCIRIFIFYPLLCTATIATGNMFLQSKIGWMMKIRDPAAEIANRLTYSILRGSLIHKPGFLPAKNAVSKTLVTV